MTAPTGVESRTVCAPSAGSGSGESTGTGGTWIPLAGGRNALLGDHDQLAAARGVGDAEPHLGGADEDRHVPVRVLVVAHELVRERDLAERERARQARIDLALEHQLVDALRLLVVREVRALQPLLAHPVVAQVDASRCSRSCPRR